MDESASINLKSLVIKCRSNKELYPVLMDD